ncbi:hypothetical protein Pelo_17602 [Pelomyxa schiedti]|nr:hypothetical protein Pelo_17602 [Pelomyxa schiedti]
MSATTTSSNDNDGGANTAINSNSSVAATSTASTNNTPTTCGRGGGVTELVRLNVGGKVFCTTRTTLAMATGPNGGSSFFTVLLSGRIPSTLDETGAYFIDRNGDLFAPILDFMRTGKLIVPPCIHVDAIYNEAEYYQVQLPERPAPPQQHQSNATVYDFMAFKICYPRWGNESYGSNPQVSLTCRPDDNALAQLVSDMPIRERYSLCKVVTYISEHSGWRVVNWTRRTKENDFNGEKAEARVYLCKP